MLKPNSTLTPDTCQVCPAIETEGTLWEIFDNLNSENTEDILDLCVPVTSALSYRRGRPPKVVRTPEMREAVRRMYEDEGLVDKDIAAILGVHVATMGNIRKEFGIPSLFRSATNGIFIRQENSFHDLTGKRFSRWLVLQRSENYQTTGASPQSHAQYLCRCDCGEESLIRGSILRRGGSKSCGCLAAEVTRERTRNDTSVEATIHMLYLNYRRGAADRDYSFNMSEDEFLALIKMPCHYCGQPPSSRTNFWLNKDGTPRPLQQPDAQWVGGAWLLHHGVDRVDNSVGYEKFNVVTACKNCNRAKSELSIDGFLNMVRDIYTHLKLGEQP